MALRRGPLARQIRTYSRICSRLTASSTLLFYAVKEPKNSRTPATVEAMVLFRARRRYKSLPAASGTAAATCARTSSRGPGAVRFARSDLADWDRRHAPGAEVFRLFLRELDDRLFWPNLLSSQNLRVAGRCFPMLHDDCFRCMKKWARFLR